MARKKNTAQADEKIEDAVVINDNELAEHEVETRLSIAEKIAQIIDPDDKDYFCRIYREVRQRGGGNIQREFLERVDGYLVDEEYLAENFGGGVYLVRYTFKENGTPTSTSGNFTISDSYRPKSGSGAVTHSQEQQQKNPVASFLEGLNAEKVGGILAAIEGVRKIFAPPVDLTELMKVMLANKQQSVGDAVLIEALKGAQRQPTAPVSILDQIKQIQEVKEILAEEQEEVKQEENGGSTMDFIKTALSMLPTFLKQNNGDFGATGAQFRENPLVNNLLTSDPGLAEKFITAARDKFGEQQAKQLAEGFGYHADFVDRPQTQEPAPTANNGV